MVPDCGHTGGISQIKKIATLADLLRKLDASEVPIAVGFLSGTPRQGRVGVGYRTVYGIDVPPAHKPNDRFGVQ